MASQRRQDRRDSADDGDGTPPPPPGDNSRSRLEIVKEKYARLNAIEAEKKVLNDEAEDIRASLEKDMGLRRGAVADVRKLQKLGSATSILAHEKSRSELVDIFIKPILDEAAAGQADE